MKAPLTAGLLLLLLAQCVRAAAPISEPERAHNEANRHYEQGQFSKAAAAYHALATNGVISPNLLFNLGNAFFKSGQIGRAILSYRQALEFAPRDPDVQANLRFARDQSQGPSLGVPVWQRAAGRLTLNEWTVAASASAWLLVALLVFAQFRPASWSSIRSVTLALGCITILLAAGTAAAWYARQTTVAIVVQRSAEVRYGPLDESQPAFTAFDGAELRVVDKKDEWLRVEAAAAKSGWIKQEHVLIP